MKLLYRYLFISDRGRPLSLRALSNLLDRLFLTIELAHLVEQLGQSIMKGIIGVPTPGPTPTLLCAPTAAARFYVAWDRMPSSPQLSRCPSAAASSALAYGPMVGID